MEGIILLGEPFVLNGSRLKESRNFPLDDLCWISQQVLVGRVMENSWPVGFWSQNQSLLFSRAC